MRLLPIVLLVACTQVADPAAPLVDAPDPVADPGADPVVTPDPTEPLPAAAWEVPTGTRGESRHALVLGDGEWMMVAPDEGGVWLGSGPETRFVDLRAEVTMLAQLGHVVLATFRDTGELAVLERFEDAVTVTHRVHLGAEPYDLALSQDSDHVYVSLSTEGAVVEVDLASLTETRRWDVYGEPRHLALLPSHFRGDERLVVAPAYDHRITEVHLSTGATTLTDLPMVPSETGQPLVPRITGDINLDPATGEVWMPAMYAGTRLSGVPGPTATDPNQPSPREEESLMYGSLPNGEQPGAIGVFNPMLVKFGAGAYPMPLATAEGTPNGTPLTEVRGVPTAAIPLDPASMVTSGRNVVLVPSTSGHLHVMLPDVDSFAEPPENTRLVGRVSLRVGAGPRGALLTDPHSTLMRSVAAYEGTVVDLDMMMPIDMAEHAAVDPFMGSMLGLILPDVAHPVGDLPVSALPADVYRGRALFHAAGDHRIALPGTGASCASCHTEGRTDGRTWRFDDMPRQVPSLAGSVSATTPLTWTGEVATVLDEVHTTSDSRMGGSGLTDGEAMDVAAYVDWTRATIPPAEDAALVAEGEALFHDGAVGCTACHSGTERTDGYTWPILDATPLDTPALRGLTASAPYMHDASARTLRDVLELGRDGTMGNTGHLTDAQMDALAAYLRTL
jgi:mono/diheme cytochrome c family protein